MGRGRDCRGGLTSCWKMAEARRKLRQNLLSKKEGRADGLGDSQPTSITKENKIRLAPGEAHSGGDAKFSSVLKGLKDQQSSSPTQGSLRRDQV